MSNTQYKCVKCGNGISATSHPKLGRCSKGDGHEWVIEDGIRKNFKCIKCGNGVSGVSHPLVGKCSKGGEHRWVS